MPETTSAALIEAAERAVPVLAQYADWGETHGRLHDEAFAALVQAGIGRLFLPRSLGGVAVDPVTCARVTETLTRGDASAAWYVMVFNAARLMAASWPEEMVRAVWDGQPDTLVAASGHTPLKGKRRGEGVFVEGRNSFVSGCHHARFMMSPMDLEGEPHMVVVPMSECEIVDNWDTLGMRGTGSNDVAVPGTEVPGAMVAPMSAAPLRNALYSEDTLYSCPSRVVFATYVPVALQLAEQALGHLTDLAQNKVPYASDVKLAERKVAQVHFGKALATYRSARLYFFDALEAAWEAAGNGCDYDARARADLYLAGTHAMQSSAMVVRHVADAAGSSATRRSSPLERIGRDIETLRHHGFANESRYASVTQVHWGVELDYPLLLR